MLDVSLNSSNVTYSNGTLTFPIPGFNINDEIYITFDAGVLFSNSSVSSSAQTDHEFWHLIVISDATTISVSYTTGNPSAGTTYSGTTGSSMGHSDTSAMLATTQMSTFIQTTQSFTGISTNTTQSTNTG